MEGALAERHARAEAQQKQRERSREEQQRGVTRREFLRRAGGAAGMALAASTLRPPAAWAATPRIVIVGAGLAGIRCAHLLHPVPCTIYEAATDHIGGRPTGRSPTPRSRGRLKCDVSSVSCRD
jgi:monoamine oxidase